MAGADPWARPLVDFWLPAGLLALLTALFYFLPIDLRVQEWFYSAERGGWFLKDAEPLVMIYHKGLVPALCVTLGSIALLVVGFWSASLRRYRKVAIYLLLVMVIAPGLLVNALMKEGWGRPRPRQIEQFGGAEAYERVLEYDGRSYGKSFPSGHAAMGFYFFGMYFLMRREGRRALLFWLGVALGLGFVLGLTRMAQGGHFPSDVLWSAGVCYFVAAGAYYAMGLHRSLWYGGGRMSRSALVGCLVALLGIGLLGVGTPYHEEKDFPVGTEDLAGAEVLQLKLALPRCNLRLSVAGGFSLRAEAEGFGAPGSRLEDSFESARVGGRCEIRLTQEKSGFFATLEQPMSLMVPGGLAFDGELEVASGVVILDLGRLAGAAWDVDLELGEVELSVLVPDGLELKVELEQGVEVGGSVAVDNQLPGLVWDGVKRRFRRGEQPSVKLRIGRQLGGKIEFRKTGGGSD